MTCRLLPIGLSTTRVTLMRLWRVPRKHFSKAAMNCAWWCWLGLMLTEHGWLRTRRLGLARKTGRWRFPLRVQLLLRGKLLLYVLLMAGPDDLLLCSTRREVQMPRSFMLC